jgi:hypothetical protein
MNRVNKIAVLILMMVAMGPSIVRAQNNGLTSVEAVTEQLVDGNARPRANLNTPAGTAYFRYSFSGDNYTWHPTNAIPDAGNPRTGRTVDASSPVILETRGMAVTGAAGSSTQYVDFQHCILTPNPLCSSPQRFRFRVDPSLALDNTSTITVDGSYPRVVTLQTEISLQGARINASCASTTTPAATLSVSPAFANTNSEGRVSFSIQASNLRVIAPSGANPSGTCTFQAANSSKTAVVNVQGQRIAPSLQLSPSSENLGSAPETTIDRTITVSTSSPVAANVTINASCSSEQTSATVRLDNAVTPAATATLQKQTAANGKATFRVIAENLVSLTETPRIRCNFNVVGLTAVAQYTASGKRINPTFSLNPAQITRDGETPVTVTMNPPYAGFSMTHSCTQQNTTVSVVVPTGTTSTAGQQVFRVNVNPLMLTNPDTQIQPSATCRFGINGDWSPNLTFRTGNVCAMALSPLLAACGAPAD